MKHHGQYETIENAEDFKILRGSHYKNSDEVKSFLHSEVQKAKENMITGKDI